MGRGTLACVIVSDETSTDGRPERNDGKLTGIDDEEGKSKERERASYRPPGLGKHGHLARCSQPWNNRKRYPCPRACVIVREGV